MPAVAELTVKVAVPEPPTTVALPGVTVSPAGALGVMVTVPVKPLIGAMVTVTVAVEPTLTVTRAGLALIVKSVKLKVALAPRISTPSVPVIATT